MLHNNTNKTTTTTWISEKLAAEILHRNRRTVREKAKSGAWPISMTMPDKKGYLYSLQDINNFLESMSTHVRAANIEEQEA